MKIKIKRLHPNAKLPSYAHYGDAGMDLYSNEDFALKAGEIYTFNTGIAIEIPHGYVSIIHDKSGLASKYGLKTIGGVIDSGYRGEYGVILINLSDQLYEIKRGDKIAQLLIQPIIHAEIEEVEELSIAERGTNAFGSSGRS